MQGRRQVSRSPALPRATVLIGALVLAQSALAGTVPSFFSAGNLVVIVEGNGMVNAAANTQTYLDDQASPMTLFQYKPTGTSSATYVNALVLPQTAAGKNLAVSAEYGSSSEGTLQLSGNGQYLTLMGYGVNAAAYNANPAMYGTALSNTGKSVTALAQSGSMTNQSVYTPVARVAVLINGVGTVDSTTGLFNVFNDNNPRSAFSVDGSAFYVSGQGTSGDATGGVFYAAKGSSSAVAITGLDTKSGPTKTPPNAPSAQDTRIVQVVNGQLLVSADSTQGVAASNRDFIGTLGAAGVLPTALANNGAGPAQLNGFGTSSTGMLKLTTSNGNSVNLAAAGKTVNLSPEGFFFANASTLYVADSGIPKNATASSTLGDGGLQKWTNSSSDGSGLWSLDYTLSSGLNLVANTATAGSTGLLGLTGKVVGSEVQLFATNYTLGDTDPTFLFGISDTLLAMTKNAGASFAMLATAPADSTFKGVAFAPTADASAVPEPSTTAMFVAGLGTLLMRRRQKS